jgi:hypothetical protein
MPHLTNLLGFNTFKEALSAHKIYQKKQKLPTYPGPGPSPNSGPGPGHPIDSASNSPTSSIAPTSPTTFNFADILHDFDDGNYGSENDEDDRRSLGFEGDADEEDNDTSDAESIVPISQKPGKRYTALDFDFLKEEWLEPTDWSSDSSHGSDTSE